jgi:hypothetical protein
LTWLQAGVELVKAFFSLITGVALPIVIILIAWWFRKEIARLIDRISKLKALGTELEPFRRLKKDSSENVPKDIRAVFYREQRCCSSSGNDVKRL